MNWFARLRPGTRGVLFGWGVLWVAVGLWLLHPGLMLLVGGVCLMVGTVGSLAQPDKDHTP